MVAISGESFRHLRQGKYEVNGAGGDGRARHSIELGLLRILSNHNAAGDLDRPCPRATVIAGSREHDRDRALTERRRERMEQEVERHSDALTVPGIRKSQRAIDDREKTSG